MEHVYFRTNGIRLHAVAAGPEQGPLVILLHGFPEFWYGWRHQIGPLAHAGFRVVALDQRGYNLSDKPVGVRAYAVDELVRDLIGVLDALECPTCYIAGHDWGAAIAWAAALFVPGRVERLAVLNVPHPAVMLHFLSHSPRQMLRSWYIGFFQLPKLPELVLGARRCRGALDAIVRTGGVTTFSTDELEQYREALLRPGSLTAMLNWYRALARYRPALPANPRVRVPTLILWGQDDIALGFEMVQPSVDLCDRVKLVVYRGASHWVQHDEKKAVAEELTRFFCGDTTVPQG